MIWACTYRSTQTASLAAQEERLRNSPEYKKSRKRVGKALKKLDDLGLSEEQMDVIDDVLTVCKERGWTGKSS